MVKLSKIFSKNENEKHQQNEGKMKPTINQTTYNILSKKKIELII